MGQKRKEPTDRGTNNSEVPANRHLSMFIQVKRENKYIKLLRNFELSSLRSQLECWPPARRAYASERILGSKRHSAKGRE